MLMVNPGFAGQKMVPSTMKKMEKMGKYLLDIEKQSIEIEVDGNITLEKAKILSNNGANIFVAGTSCLFNDGLDQYKTKLSSLRSAVN